MFLKQIFLLLNYLPIVNRPADTLFEINGLDQKQSPVGRI